MTNLYLNNFIYCKVEPEVTDKGRGLIHCSGINLSRFLPITAGRHGLASNPALRGLELTNIELRSYVIGKGLTPRTVRGTRCSGIAPTQETWFSEELHIDGADESFCREAMEFTVINLSKKVIKTCIPEVVMPKSVIPSNELEGLFASLVERYGRKFT